jgi:hypothetical protein
MAMASPPLSTGLRVHSQHVPQGGTLPAVVYAFLSGFRRAFVGDLDAYTDQQWLIYVGDKAKTSAHLAPIADRIDAVLKGASGSAAGGQVLYCSPGEEFYDEREVEGGTYEVRLGRRWTIYAEGA